MPDDLEALSIAPGQSPFRVKGVVYLGHLDYVQRFVVGGLPGMFASFRDPRQAEFFRQHFLHASFYDILPLVAAGHVCARQARLTFGQFVKVRSRFQAERDIEGVHRALIRFVSPETAVSRLPALQSQYLDFPGHGEASLAEPGRAVMGRRQLPLLLSRWFTIVYETYIEVILGAAGAKSVVVRSNASEEDAPAFGFKTVKFRCEALWD